MVDVKPRRDEEPETQSDMRLDAVSLNSGDADYSFKLPLWSFPAPNTALGPLSQASQAPLGTLGNPSPGDVNIQIPPPVLIWEYDVIANYSEINAPESFGIIHQHNTMMDDDTLIQEHVAWEQTGSEMPAPMILETMLDVAKGVTALDLPPENFLAQEEFAKEVAAAQGSRSQEGSSKVSLQFGENTGAYDPEEFENEQDDDKAEEAHGAMVPEHMVSLGDNEATNVAVIADLIEAETSVVVMGDYYATNAIFQTNIFMGSGNDVAQFAGGATQYPQDTLINTGGTEKSGEVLIPSFVSGATSLYSFDVDVAHGDYFNVTALQQFNYLSDNDHIQYELNTGGSFISLGDNTQVNAAQVIKDVSEYDMIITAGDYFDFNYISQKNILLDADEVLWDAEALTGSGEGNALINDARISNVGGGTLFKAMGSGEQAFFEALKQQDESFSFRPSDYENGFPQIGSSEFKVLYVTGNSYHMNAIEQINVLSDLDSGRVVGNDPSLIEDEDIENFGSGGGNLARNKAEIIDYDSQSAFQYLGGSYSEEELQIQVNLNMDDDRSVLQHGNAASDLVAELVAFTQQDSEAGPQFDGVALASLQTGDLFTDLLT
ncbi:hypothetical protein A3843_06850 [Pseudovibrio exalbescens]|uniref:Uncharacterized protein n=2 Tax=Pseudovibrio exalbescens TaxID=197461 RepID=A0A1U7JJ93_9HYPH|nr:hypothetical protein A3843_06850 [Pseudovibrio exalbescens]